MSGSTMQFGTILRHNEDTEGYLRKQLTDLLQKIHKKKGVVSLDLYLMSNQMYMLALLTLGGGNQVTRNLQYVVERYSGTKN